MKTFKNFLRDYLAAKEQSVVVNRDLEKSLKGELFTQPMQRAFPWGKLSIGLTSLALVAIAFNFSLELKRMTLFSLGPQGVADGPFSYEHENINCENDCENVVLVVNGVATSKLEDKACAACSEANIWANMDSAYQGFTLAGYALINGVQHNLPTRFITFADNPDWEQQTYEFEIGDDTVGIRVQRTDEWNMIQDISCVGDCDDLRVGSYGTTFIDNCPIPPCDIIDIQHGGIEFDNVIDSYAVSAYKQGDILAADNSGKVLLEKTYTPDQLPENGVLHFSETIDGHMISFDILVEPLDR